MSSVNKSILLGRIGQNPDVRHLENGNKVANFSIATSEKYTDKNTGERKEITDWHNVVIWGKLAEIVEKYVKKGDLVYIEGKSRTRSWEKEGITRYTTEVIADQLVMLGGNQKEQKSEPVQQYQEQQTSDVPTDDLPF